MSIRHFLFEKLVNNHIFEAFSCRDRYELTADEIKFWINVFKQQMMHSASVNDTLRVGRLFTDGVS